MASTTGAGVNPSALDNVLTNKLARMLPQRVLQNRVYRLGESSPPGLNGYGPSWQVATLVLAARTTGQMRISVPPDFHLLAINSSATVATALGAFRAQFYDVKKKKRFGDRGTLFANIGGQTGQTFFLREPYQFDKPNSQVLVLIQNLEAGANTIQIVLYGVALGPTQRRSL